jgi:hypothetical protein
MEKGYSLKDSSRLADLYATNNQAFVNIMMMEELGLVVGDEITAVKCGIATFVAYLVLGFLPSIPYIICLALSNNTAHPVIPVLIIGAIELFSLGFASARLIGSNPIKGGM